MRALVAAFGDTLPDVDTGALLAWLDKFSERWDFRRHGRLERDQVPAARFAPELETLIRNAATALGLVVPLLPPEQEYDHLLVLGGLRRACLQRAEYAATLVAEEGIHVREIIALGSFRPLSDAERAFPPLTDYGYEVDALEEGIRIGFGLTGAPRERCSPGGITHESWTVRTFDDWIYVLAAPSSEPAKRRANTPDAYRFWADEVRLRPEDRILVVTSPIYVPFQHCDAIAILGLPYRCGIHTVGFDPARVTVSQAAGAAGAERYLQEIRSAVLSMARLHAAIDTTADSA